MTKLLVWCVFFTVAVADPEPNLASLVTAPFKFVKWLTGSHSNKYDHNNRYYHHDKYYDDNRWHYHKKRSVPDIESTDTGLAVSEYTTPPIAGPLVSFPLDNSGIRRIQKRSIDSLHEEAIPEPILLSPYPSIFVQEDNLVHDSYSPFIYFENNFKYDVVRETEEMRNR